ncbi:MULTISPECIES: dual specificity protein phosphatase family protein [unclassified Duganella]|uniref:phosphatase domain-containing putative toxin n=1 Tax=unclassified Duganella TaxID=2636909 RepID=UPI0009EB742F|nr:MULTISPECIES: dual specificity protein phosphatase family protein [unclassified Duganella]
MSAEVYWVRDIEPLRLAIMPRPRGGDWLEDEIAGWKRSGVTHVVSLLHRYEIEELSISNEAALCKVSGIEYKSLPIQDRSTPASSADFFALVHELTSLVQNNHGVAVHCRAGIGRSGLTAACVLLKLGIPAAEAFAILSRARRLPVPDTQSQVEWFHSVAVPRLLQRI